MFHVSGTCVSEEEHENPKDIDFTYKAVAY